MLKTVFENMPMYKMFKKNDFKVTKVIIRKKPV